MCTVCGCGASDQHHSHSHAHAHTHEHNHAPQSRLISLETDILAANDRFAAENRAHFARQKILALNLVSSPGSGKTTLLAKSIAALKPVMPVAVIEGDQQTDLDAERIRAAGADAVQVNTGKGCHLDAHMIGHALERISLSEGGLLFIENVGNLVCPSAFDLGEAAKVVVLSVTEGEDKPLKYPDMFAAARLMILNKIDLLPHLSFDMDKARDYALRVNPSITILALSATTGEGMDAWRDWIMRQKEEIHSARHGQRA